jgi:serine/threonine-protein kinase HipA
MATRPAFTPSKIRTPLSVYLGTTNILVGRLIYVKEGSREFSQFAYSDEWLSNSQFFDVSPDLIDQLGYQLRKPKSKADSCFFLALADTEPDAWGRRVIARAHAKDRAKNSALRPLTEIDYVAAVDDFSRMGALRLQNENGQFLRSVAEGSRATPAFIELEKILLASRAVEMSNETAEDLKYLQGKGTSLGGMRPKCTILDIDGALSLGKFPSVNDERSVTRGEVLALHLATLAGINSAQARVVTVQNQPVAIIRRFDRTAENNRIPYMSGATLLQANRDEEHSYTELIDVMRSRCKDFSKDANQLWRRLVFNHLITNIDDHLQNIGFLYVANNQWQLAPAFDLNPFPEKDSESKTWLSEDTGPITSIQQLISQAGRFELSESQAKAILAEVISAVKRWKDVAVSDDVGMQASELAAFKPAFEKAVS